MTAAVSRTRPTTGSRTTSRRPKLQVLDHRPIRQRARRRNALLVLFVVVLLGFFAVAFVHAELVAGQQDLDAVRARIAEAEAHKARVARAAEEASSPQQIVLRAEELGMVRAYQPVYLQAVAPEREVPIIAALAPAASRTVNQVAAAVPGVSTGISGNASVPVPVTEGADPVVAIAAAGGGDTGGATASPTSALAVPPDPEQPPAAAASSGSADDSGSLGGTSVSVSGAAPSGASVSRDAAAPSGLVSGISVSSPGVSSAGGAATSSSIAGSRAVAGGLGEGNGSG